MNFYRRSRMTAACLLLLCSLLSAAGLAKAAPPLEVYGKLPGFEMAAISPSGDHVAILGRIGSERQVLLLNRDGKPVKQVVVGDVKVRGLYWAGDGNLLIWRSNIVDLGIGFTADKAELTGVIVLPVGKEPVWQIFDKQRFITGGVSGFYGLTQRDGKWFGYFGGMTMDPSFGTSAYLNSTDPILYEVDLQNRSVDKIAGRINNQEDWRTWQVGHDGKVAATLDYHSTDGNWVIRNGSGKVIAQGTSPLGNIDLVGFADTVNDIIYSQDDPESGNNRWFQVPLVGGEAKEILSEIGNAFRVVDPHTRGLVGYQIDGDQPAYHFFDPYRDKVAAAVQKAFPGLSVHLEDWNATFDRLIVRTEGPGDPMSWWLVDYKTKRADPLGTSYPMPAQDVAPMKMISYKAGDGMDIAAVLTLPPGREPKNLPVVVLPHGGPTARDYPGFDWWAQAFASRGYAVLQPNFRGSSGYGADFERAGHGEWGRKMQTDISEGLAFLVQQGIADRKRACIMGASYGGYAALAGVTLQQGLYRCAVSVAGVSDVAKMARTDLMHSGYNQATRRWLKEEVGSGGDLSAVSPIRFADKADAAILLIHGKDDTVVLYDQSNDMAAALRRAGKPVEFVTLAGEDHGLSRSETRRTMLEAAMAFVQKHNPADPPPSK